MPSPRILAIDDEPRYLRLIRGNVEKGGYAFVGAGDGERALDVLVGTPIDLILLDVRMPGANGFALAETIREYSDVPIIFVSALGEEADKVRGLKLGADDYITKPFGADELMARIEAVLRRSQLASRAEPVVRIGNLRVDLAQRLVFRDEQEVRLTRMEFRLLAYFVRLRGKVLPQDQLVHSVWGSTYDEDYEGLRIYVHRLRHKLETDPEQPRLLLTYPGIGYCLKPPPIPEGVEDELLTSR
jgi:two-component system, OmpR family, KDP operon response regulator KdpE